MIAVAQLVAAGIHPTQARLFVDPLNEACSRYGITTPVRIAAFVAQCRHESSGFTELEENLYYTTPEHVREVFHAEVPSLDVAATLCRNPVALANRVYANRLGNGPESSGDGWAFRARSPVGITGRDAYAALTDIINDGNDFTSVPDLIAQPHWACIASAAWWVTHGCNTLADSSQIDAITRVVNGPGMLGAMERRENFREALIAFAQPASATA